MKATFTLSRHKKNECQEWMGLPDNTAWTTRPKSRIVLKIIGKMSKLAEQVTLNKGIINRICGIGRSFSRVNKLRITNWSLNHWSLNHHHSLD